MPKTADFIEESKSLTTKAGSKKKGVSPKSIANLIPYPKGVSGNPGGKPKRDIAKEIAQAIFENNIEGAYTSLGKALLKGNAYVFKELAERAYGKLKESKEITHLYADESDGTLDQQIAALERKLGLAREIDDASRSGLEAAGAGKAAENAQDPAILPR